MKVKISLKWIFHPFRSKTPLIDIIPNHEWGGDKTKNTHTLIHVIQLVWWWHTLSSCQYAIAAVETDQPWWVIFATLSLHKARQVAEMIFEYARFLRQPLQNKKKHIKSRNNCFFRQAVFTICDASHVRCFKRSVQVYGTIKTHPSQIKMNTGISLLKKCVCVGCS